MKAKKKNNPKYKQTKANLKKPNQKNLAFIFFKCYQFSGKYLLYLENQLTTCKGFCR